MGGDAPKNPRSAKWRVDAVWPVGEAKARLSEVIELAHTEGPQTIAKRGRPVAVVVSVDEWDRKTKRKGTLLEFLQTAPPEFADLDLERVHGHPRPVDFGV